MLNCCLTGWSLEKGSFEKSVLSSSLILALVEHAKGFEQGLGTLVDDDVSGILHRVRPIQVDFSPMVIVGVEMQRLGGGSCFIGDRKEPSALAAIRFLKQ